MRDDFVTHFPFGGIPMENVWKTLYDAAKAVQNQRKISDYVEAGGVAAAIQSESGRSNKIIDHRFPRAYLICVY